MTDASLIEDAERVRRDLAQDLRLGFESLIQFARDRAINPALRNDAILLKMALDPSPTEDSENAAHGDALVLIEEILHDNATANPEARARKARRDAVLNSFHARDTPRGVMLRARGLGYLYARSGFHLRGVDLDLRQGEITGVIGENANGKTTLFRILVGELKHKEGTLTYPGLGAEKPEAINWATVKRGIAYVPQTLGRWFGSLEDNLRYAAAIKGITGAANDQEIDYIIERLGLRDYLNHGWDALSGGFKLRFELARALVWKPKLLVLDEPLANLDFRSQLVILRDLRDLANSFTNPIAVVLSSQHLYEVEAVADRILFLKQGHVVFNGLLADVGANRTQNVYELGCDLDLSELRARLRDANVLRVAFDGISKVIYTHRALGRTEMIRLLLDRDIDIRYFRDISRSVKQLFDVEQSG